MIENLFGLLYLLALPLWLAMLLFPRTRITQQAVTSPWPFIALGAIYAVLLLAALTSLAPSQLALSVEALQAVLAGGWGLLAVWAHLLIFDLFVGVWIFRDARYWRISPTLYLIATHLAGPFGLGLYLFLRRRHERNDPFRVVN